MINSIDWNNLSVNQKDLLAQRYVLIKYLDRLECYIEIVDRYQRYSKDVYFEKDFYIKFRDQPILEATVKFAHEGKSRAVATLLERYPQDLEDYRLCILSNFPESLSPDEFTDLIPSVDDLLDDQTDVEDMEDDPDLEKDWIHQESILEKVPAHVKQLDLVNLPFSQYKTQRLTRQVIMYAFKQYCSNICKNMEKIIGNHFSPQRKFKTRQGALTLAILTHDFLDLGLCCHPLGLPTHQAPFMTTDT